MNELALFAGAGGGILGAILNGWRTVCAVEIEPGARAKLAARQNDGCLPPFPIWDDVRTFDGTAWRGSIDVVTGGFPCQDISVAGTGDGLDGERSGLWREMARIIGEVRPRYLFVENSPALTFRGGVRVLGDLATMGYDCRWGVMGAADAIWLDGTPCLDHLRERIWIAGARADTDLRGRWADLATGHDQNRDETGRDEGNGFVGAVSGPVCEAETGTNSKGKRWGEVQRPTQGSARHAPVLGEGESRPHAKKDGRPFGHGEHVRRMFDEALGQRRRNESRRVCANEQSGTSTEGSPDSNPDRTGCCEQRGAVTDGQEHQAIECGSWWATEPDVGRMAHGVADRVDRLYCVGNGQVPAVVKLAWETLKP